MTYQSWTLEKAEDFCEKVYQYVLENKGCYTLGGAAVECGEYEDVIWYLQDKYSTNFSSIKKAKEILRNRCIELGMNNKTNPTMTIFNLVNNFDMVNTNSKSKIDATVESKPKDLSKLTEEELLQLDAITKKLGSPSGDIS